MGDVQVKIAMGTVVSGSGMHGWRFNIERFAAIYAANTCMAKGKVMTRLCGDAFFNAKYKIWTNAQQADGVTDRVLRAFCSARPPWGSLII